METAVNIAQKKFQPNRPSSLGDIANFIRENSARNPDKFTATFVTKNKMEFQILEKRRVISGKEGIFGLRASERAIEFDSSGENIKNELTKKTLIQLPAGRSEKERILIEVRSRDFNFFHSSLPARQRA